MAAELGGEYFSSWGWGWTEEDGLERGCAYILLLTDFFLRDYEDVRVEVLVILQWAVWMGRNDGGFVLADSSPVMAGEFPGKRIMLGDHDVWIIEFDCRLVGYALG